MSREPSGRLEGLVAEWGLPEAAARQIATVLELVEVETASITTVRDPAEAVGRHVADSLAGLLVPELRDAGKVADIGSGGGFPGLVLAAALPETAVSLVESVSRKCVFLRRAAEAAILKNVAVVQARAEEWMDGLGSQDVVTARALAPLPVLVEYAAPLLTEGGTLVAWKGAPAEDEVQQGEAAAALVGMRFADVLSLAPAPGAERRTLYLYRKVAPTPDRYPRRAGMARKRPLGS